MNNKFSIKRIGLLLRTDLIENKKNLLLYSCGIIAILIFWIWSRPLHANILISMQSFIFFILYYIVFFRYCQFVEKKINSRQSNYLMIPSNNIEKFITILLELFLLTWLVIGLFYTAMFLWNILFYSRIQELCTFTDEFSKGDFIIFNIFEKPSDTRPTVGSVFSLLTGVIMALFMLGTFTFKKWAAPITISIIAIGSMLIFYFFRDFFEFLSITNINSVIYKNHYTGLLKFIVGHKILIGNLVCLWLIYIMYLKFTEKEQR